MASPRSSRPTVLLPERTVQTAVAAGAAGPRPATPPRAAGAGPRPASPTPGSSQFAASIPAFFSPSPGSSRSSTPAASPRGGAMGGAAFDFDMSPPPVARRKATVVAAEDAAEWEDVPEDVDWEIISPITLEKKEEDPDLYKMHRAFSSILPLLLENSGERLKEHKIGLGNPEVVTPRLQQIVNALMRDDDEFDEQPFGEIDTRTLTGCELVEVYKIIFLNYYPALDAFLQSLFVEGNIVRFMEVVATQEPHNIRLARCIHNLFQLANHIMQHSEHNQVTVEEAAIIIIQTPISAKVERSPSAVLGNILTAFTDPCFSQSFGKIHPVALEKLSPIPAATRPQLDNLKAEENRLLNRMAILNREIATPVSRWAFFAKRKINKKREERAQVVEQLTRVNQLILVQQEEECARLEAQLRNDPDINAEKQRRDLALQQVAIVEECLQKRFEQLKTKDLREKMEDLNQKLAAKKKEYNTCKKSGGTQEQLKKIQFENGALKKEVEKVERILREDDYHLVSDTSLVSNDPQIIQSIQRKQQHEARVKRSNTYIANAEAGTRAAMEAIKLELVQRDPRANALQREKDEEAARRRRPASPPLNRHAIEAKGYARIFGAGR